MTEKDPPRGRFTTPEAVAKMLDITPSDVGALVRNGRLRGLPVGAPPQWRIDLDSVDDYLDGQAEIARRAALWRQSQEASFPELWGRGAVRHDD
ncbi:helix-turn-helix domain-containing protein [uncultured Microbacterium sp.]|uniref:helix-turn-helix domain-containing protein n=1 Tax=uncultured Microbacterium sp. TaxID=191216 RepID=UPI0025D89351|nr:helix-turn-helix domain-containing protein [uncultured Microbacterium sp.]